MGSNCKYPMNRFGEVFEDQPLFMQLGGVEVVIQTITVCDTENTVLPLLVHLTSV